MKLNLYKGADHKQLDNISLEKSIDWKGNTCFMKLLAGNGGICKFCYSLDGKDFYQIGDSYQATEGIWVGAKVGLVCLSPNIVESKGYADFDWYRTE